MNIVDQVYEQARLHPDRPALIHDGGTCSYGALAPRVSEVADLLKHSGVLDAPAAPARVGLACPDGLAYVVLALGMLRAGACVVPIAAELSPVERDRLVDVLGLTGLVIGPGFEWADPPGQARTFPLPHFMDTGEAAPRVVVQTQVRPATAPPLGFHEHELAALNPAFIRFSSGTTGQSKGVVISHQTLRERIRAANEALRIGPGDRVIWVLPMAHHFAVSMMLYLTQGAATVVVGSHLAKDVLDAARAHGGTVLYGAPFHHALLAAEPSGRDWPTLRLAVSTAAALPEATAHAFEDRFGMPLTQALGVIEAGLPVINRDAARPKPTAIGKPTGGFEVELRDEAGVPIEPGQVGEVYLRGPGMFDAYLLPWKKRDHVLVDGWFRTGDLATQDGDGDLFLVGRTKSVINVAGLKIFPEEVEAVLLEHPDVQAARVVGRAHPQVGSVPVAEIVPRDVSNPPKTPDLVRFCRDRLAAYKRPMQFKMVSSLPRTASGKVKRHHEKAPADEAGTPR